MCFIVIGIDLLVCCGSYLWLSFLGVTAVMSEGGLTRRSIGASETSCLRHFKV
jgi:hypothetical protein